MDMGSAIEADRSNGVVNGKVSSHTPGVSDDLVLFRLSQQVDRVRDTAKWLLSKGMVEQSVTDRLVSTCNKVVDVICEELDGSLRSEMEALDLRQVPGCSLPEVFAVSAQLAAWIDSVHYSPAFELAQRVKHASSEKVLAELSLGVPADSVDVSSVAVSSGQYL